MTAGRNAALVHRAFEYAAEREFLAAAVPFLRTGLGADETVLVAASPARFDVLREALGADAAPVLFIDVAEWYRRPVRTIAAYDEFLRAQAPRQVRVLAELDWAGWSPFETREWTRYEAIVNEVFDTSGASALCAYNRILAPPDVLAEARRTHREMLDAGTPRHSADYTDPARFYAECDAAPLRLPPAFDSVPFESAADLSDVRTFVAARAAHYGLPDMALSGLLTAANELATNAVTHGTPPMAVRMWAADGELICEVADCGYWRPAATLGYAPPASAASEGFGLWGVRMLTDAVEIRAGWDGTVVRLHTRLSGPAS